MTETQNDTVNIRLFRRSRNRFRVKADKNGQSLMDYLDDLSKKV